MYTSPLFIVQFPDDQLREPNLLYWCYMSKKTDGDNVTLHTTPFIPGHSLPSLDTFTKEKVDSFSFMLAIAVELKAGQTYLGDPQNLDDLRLIEINPQARYWFGQDIYRFDFDTAQNSFTHTGGYRWAIAEHNSSFQYDESLKIYSTAQEYIASSNNNITEIKTIAAYTFDQYAAWAAEYPFRLQQTQLMTLIKNGASYYDIFQTIEEGPNKKALTEFVINTLVKDKKRLSCLEDFCDLCDELDHAQIASVFLQINSSRSMCYICNPSFDDLMNAHPQLFPHYAEKFPNFSAQLLFIRLSIEKITDPEIKNHVQKLYVDLDKERDTSSASRYKALVKTAHSIIAVLYSKPGDDRTNKCNQLLADIQATSNDFSSAWWKGFYRNVSLLTALALAIGAPLVCTSAIAATALTSTALTASGLGLMASTIGFFYYKNKAEAGQHLQRCVMESKETSLVNLSSATTC